MGSTIFHFLKSPLFWKVWFDWKDNKVPGSEDPFPDQHYLQRFIFACEFDLTFNLK